MAENYDGKIEELKKLYGEAKQARQQLEADWYLNLCYYMGDQWVFWNRGRIDKPKLEDWRVMFTDNRILPIVVARVAKITKNRPSFICIPSTASETDMTNAEISEKILANDWKELNLDYQHMLVEFWKEICGAGFWKIYWDSTKGESAEFLYGPDGQPIKNGKAPIRADSNEAEIAKTFYGEKGQEVQVKPRALGDMAVEVMSPFEIYPDPLARTLDECEWVIEEKIRSKEYVYKTYGVTAEEDAEVPVGIAESRMFTPTQTAGKDNPTGVRVFEYYCRPNSKHPNGKWCVWLNDKVVKEADGPNSPFADFPYVMFTSNLVPGRFWPTPVSTHLRGPQTDLNKIQSQIRENAIRIGNPPLAISREANVEWSGKPGEKMLFSDTVQNAIPQWVTPPEVPAYVREEVERIEKSIREISGIHEISNAQVPSGITAASAINLLQEADDTRLGPEVQLMEKTLAIAGTYILRLRAKWTNGNIIIRLAGEDGAWDIASFKTEVLQNIIGVEVQAGSGMPQSKAARQAAMQELLSLALQYGVPLNPRAMRKFFRDYDLGGLDRLFQDLQQDENQINREHQRLYNGEIFGINDYDNDDLHIEGHEEEMKSSKFEQLPDVIKGNFLMHWKQHKQRRIEAVNMQMQAIAGEQAAMSSQEQHQEMQLEQLKQEGKESESSES